MFQLRKKLTENRRGFTMIELLVVIVILAVLAAIVMPRFIDAARRSREAALHSDLKLMRNAIETFHADTGLYPLTLDDLTALAAPAKGNDGAADANLNPVMWHGPYLQYISDDPIAEAAFTYTKTSGVVVSSATGNGLDGTAYADW